MFEVTECYGYEQLVNSATRDTATTSSTIDLIVTNAAEKIGMMDVLLTLSDHYLVYCTFGKRHTQKMLDICLEGTRSEYFH